MSDYTILRPREEKIESPQTAGRVPYAMAFVRPQEWERPMNAHDALNHGSAFSSLVKPFLAKEDDR